MQLSILAQNLSNCLCRPPHPCSTPIPPPFQSKLQQTWDTSTWQEEYPHDIPRQRNNKDCGVFALMFINRLSLRGAAFDFLQEDMLVNVRAAITCDLLDGAITATGSRG